MLREKTQRRLCRVLFVGGCLTPLALCLGWAIARQTPTHQAILKQAATDLLGVQCEWSGHATPLPGIHELTDVRLSLFGSEKPILSANRVRLSRSEADWQVAADTVTFHQPHRATELKDALRSRNAALEATLTTKRFAVDDSKAIEYAEARGQLLRADGRLSLNAAAGEATGKFTADTSGLTAIEITTGDVALPVAWFSSPLGKTSAARFSGQLDVNGKQGAATGRVLLPESHAGDGPIPATWSPVTIGITTAEWSDGRIERIKAKVDVPRGGWVHLSLLDAATNHLGAKQTKQVAERLKGEALWYDRFACEIDLDASGATIIAGCGEQNGKALAGRIAHALLQSRGDALLLEPRENHVSLASLLRSLWPDAQAALPATSPAARLASRLPLE